jgi:hypothetical protein
MTPEADWWDHELDRVSYRENRAELLNKMMLDHLLWAKSLEQFGKDTSLAATWIAGDGQDQVTAINQAFLDAHLRIVRSVMHDLATCGPEGQLMVRDIFAEHFSMLREQGDANE